MAFGVSPRAFRRIKTAARFVILPACTAALVAACADEGTAINPGTGGTAGTGGGGAASTAGASNTVSGSATTAGTGTTPGTAGMATAGGTGGVGGTAAGGGGAAGNAATAGAGGTAGTAGTGGTDTAGTAGTGGAAPVCTVPVTGGADFNALLLGPKAIEGEAATLSGAAAVASEGSGWSGTGFADMKASEGGMTWLIVAPAAGDYVLNWSYTQQDSRDMRLTVNCTQMVESVVFTNTGDWNTAWTTGGAQKVKLVKGINQIVLETNGGSGPNFDTMVVSPPICALSGSAATTCEAERALLSGAAIVANQGSGWKDLGFADMNAAEGGVNWVLDAPFAGTYTLTFVYTQDDTRDMTLTVNGVVAAASLAFKDTNSWNTAWASDVTYDVTLKKGINSLQLATNGASGPNFDSIIVDSPDNGAGGAGGAGAGGAGGAN